MAEADAELWLDGVKVACTIADIAAGLPTVLDEVVVPWGRQSAWDQPDEGSCSFKLIDTRTAPQPLNDVVHIGQRFELFAVSQDPSPQLAYIANSFEGTAGADLNNGQAYDLDMLTASPIIRYNRATDPNCTSLTGKTAGGGATLTVSTARAEFGTTSIQIAPAAGNNSSAAYPQGATGLTVFEAGKTYTVSCYYFLAGAQTGSVNGNARRITIQTNLGTSAVSNQAPNAAGKTRLSVTFTVDPAWTVCAVRVMNGSPNAAELAWYDGLLIEEHGVDPNETYGLRDYFDGSTVQAGYLNAWQGGANASLSTQRYAATSASAKATYVSNPPHGTSALLSNASTRAIYWFGPGFFNSDWARTARVMRPGDTWTYSIMVVAPAGVRFDLVAQPRPNSYPSSFPVDNIALTFDGDPNAARRSLVGTGAMVTYTGTITYPPDARFGGFPVFGVRTYPDGAPIIDQLQVFAPASATTRELVINGRISNVVASPLTATTLEFEVTGQGGAAELANYSVGTTPWPVEGYGTRIDRVIGLIPSDAGVSASRDSQFTLAPSVAPRDVDAQPVLDLLRQYAGGVAGVAWPLYIESVPGHVWLEYANVRTLDLVQPSQRIEVDACAVDRGPITFTQSPDNVITLVEQGWKMQGVEDPSVYEDRTVQLIDEPAAEELGYRALRLSSEIASELGAELVGQEVLDRARVVDWAVSGLAVQSDHLAQDDLMRLLSGRRRVRALVVLQNLPEYVPASLAYGWLEGGTISYQGGRWYLELYLSAADTGS